MKFSPFTIPSMAPHKFTSLLLTALLFCVLIIDCDSISTTLPPNMPQAPSSYPVDHGTSPGPISNLEPCPPTTEPPWPIPDPPTPPPFAPSQGIKAAYWPSGDGFPPSSIDTSYFTHIYYAFLLPDPTTYRLNITPFDEEMLPEFTFALSARNPPVKTLLSIGGGGNDPNVFSKMVSNESTRASFIDSTIQVAREYLFDGVDLDWEFPANDTDMSNLALLFKEWREALEKEANAKKEPPLLLTTAVYFSSTINLLGVTRTYPGQVMGRYADWISPMCFDYHGAWDPVTGEHSALYDHKSNISTMFGIQSWIQVGLQPEKIVMGLPLYGRTWKLRDPNANGIGAPASGAGPGNGVLLYSQILEFNMQYNATVKFDAQSRSFYSHAGDSWIGYDEVRSVKLKVRFALSRSLGGYFFWALGQDKNWTLSSEASKAWGY